MSSETEYQTITIRAHNALVELLDSIPKDAGVTRDQAASMLAALTIRHIPDDTGWIEIANQRPAPGRQYLVWAEGWEAPEVDWYGPLNDPDDMAEFATYAAITHWREAPAIPMQPTGEAVSA